MTYFILCGSQKGGVGKSVISQLISSGYADAGYSVLLADMDRQQKSSCNWDLWRENAGNPLKVTVKSFGDIADVLKVKEDFDMIVFDGAPHATVQTLEMAKLANLIILPTSTSRADMEPQVHLANELVSKGIPKENILFVFNRLRKSDNERENAYDYLAQTPFKIMKDYLEDKTSFVYANEQGRSFLETRTSSLNARAQKLFSNISATLLKSIGNGK